MLNISRTGGKNIDLYKTQFIELEKMHGPNPCSICVVRACCLGAVVGDTWYNSIRGDCIEFFEKQICDDKQNWSNIIKQ